MTRPDPEEELLLARERIRSLERERDVAIAMSEQRRMAGLLLDESRKTAVAERDRLQARIAAALLALADGRVDVCARADLARKALGGGG